MLIYQRVYHTNLCMLRWGEGTAPLWQKWCPQKRSEAAEVVPDTSLDHDFKSDCNREPTWSINIQIYKRVYIYIIYIYIYKCVYIWCVLFGILWPFGCIRWSQWGLSYRPTKARNAEEAGPICASQWLSQAATTKNVIRTGFLSGSAAVKTSPKHFDTGLVEHEPLDACKIF